jgi:hypothetical protein
VHIGDGGPFSRERREKVRSDGNVNINGAVYVAWNERFIVFVIDRPRDIRFSSATLP